MHSHSSRLRKGSALITVIMISGLMAVLASSMLSYSISERRGNERNRLILRARNVAENSTIYAAEQLTAKLYRFGSASNMAFDWSGSSRNRVYPPPDSVLNSAFSSASDVEIRAGIATASALTLVNDTTDPNFGLQVSKARVPIIAKATVKHPTIGNYTAHVQQDMEIALTPLFQFGMFYNMDLELYPSQTLTISGPVHSNMSVMAKPYGSTNIDCTFLNRTTAAGGLYASASIKAPTRSGTGSLVTESASSGNVVFYHTNGTPTSLKNSSNLWRDHKYTTSTETATTIANFRTFATNTYNGNLRTSAHGVTSLELPGIGSYKETNDPSTPEDDRSNGRQIIEPPDAPKFNGFTWVASTDSPGIKETKIAYKAGLYIMVNPDSSLTPRSGTLPDGTTAYVLPGSYRAWINYLDNADNRICTEVVLPGQPSYGYGAGPDGSLGTADDVMYRNYLPNRFTELTAAGAGNGNQVVRIPQGGYNLASGYRLNGAHNTIGTTTLAVNNGTGRILAGEVINIAGTYRYVVAEDYPGGSGTLKIMPPGLLAAAANNATINVEQWGLNNTPSPAYKTFKASGTYAAGDTKIDLRLISSGTGGAIIPGTAITIGPYKYLVTAAPVSSGITSGNYNSTNYPIGVGALRAAVASNVNTTVDTTPFDLGTGVGYRLNGNAAAGATTLTLNTGAGTILPGDTLFVDGARQIVVSTASTPPASAPTVGIYPGADGDGIPNASVVVVDPFKYSGYSRSSVYPVANMGRAFPADGTATLFPADAYFFDTRRANSNRGVTGLSGTTATYNRTAVPYSPRPVAKIDFDMTRFKMMVTRVLGSNVRTSSNNTSVSIYDVRAPNTNTPNTVTWNKSIFNSSASRETYGLGIWRSASSDYSLLPANSNDDTRIRPDPFNIYFAPAAPEDSDLANVLSTPENLLVPASLLYDGNSPDAWFDGFAVYIHSVDAEKRAQASGVPYRVDSGVRIWNGRGPVASLNITNVTGFTLVTNDALYTIGHFNADGTINANTSSTTNPGGYSATYSDNADERLCSLMGDGYTALSQPLWSNNSGGQTSGWSDALSAFPVGTTSSDWETGNSTVNGNYDGVYVSSAAGGNKPGLLPNQSYAGSLGSARNTKLPVVATEISSALLVGIVPSNHNPIGLTDGFVPASFMSWGTPSRPGNGVNSGGANNFPRLLEAWDGTGLYIRGSMVALFESRVAMEPFTNGRNYTAPGRFWGLHYNFSQASHDLPLEPIVLGSSRVGFRELTPAEYAAKKTQIESWPH